MSSSLFTIMASSPEKPRAVYFLPVKSKQSGNGKNFGKNLFEDVTKRVQRLEIDRVEGEADGMCWLLRRDGEGHMVWRTRHPSLQETFWHAEWEYGVRQDEWKGIL